MRTKPRATRRWFWRLCLIAAIATVAIGSLLLMLLQKSSIPALHAGIDAYHYPLTALRVAVIGTIALSWPRLIRFSEHRGTISIDRSIELASLRWRVFAWLLCIEALIGQDLIGQLVDTSDDGSA